MYTAHQLTIDVDICIKAFLKWNESIWGNHDDSTSYGKLRAAIKPV